MPFCPGVTLPSYQPARLWFRSGGTSTAPLAARPSRITGAATLSLGISIRTGREKASGAAIGPAPGVGTAVPTEAGIRSAAP